MMVNVASDLGDQKLDDDDDGYDDLDVLDDLGDNSIWPCSQFPHRLFELTSSKLFTEKLSNVNPILILIISQHNECWS